MAVFDPGEQRMCVRVVYDGAAGAGKTTNLRQLGNLFATQKAVEVLSPVELRGRTLYFDWMQIAAGVVCGFPLICQVISVPGQVAFTERRRHLLASADVVVYVCESTKAGAARAREAMRIIDEIGKSTGVAPALVVQANKQDQVGAVNGATLVQELGRSGVPNVEAIATEGIGVVDTFVCAVRTVARTLQSRMERDGLRIPVRPAPEMNQVLAQVAATPIDPYGAAELLLEEASASLAFDGLHGDPLRAVAGPSRTVFEKGGKPAENALAKPASPKKAPAAKVPDAAKPIEVAPPNPAGDGVFAPLPTADVPTGFIWPAHTGRATLRKLAHGGALARSIHVDANVVEHRIEDHVLSTSKVARFGDAENARQALVRAARERTQLGSLLVADTLLVVQPSSDGASWLWTVSPRVEPIREWLDGQESRRRLELLASAIAQAISVSVHHDLALQPTLRAFGAESDNVRYVGLLGPSGGSKRAAMLLLDGVSSDLASMGHDAESFIASIERELPRRLEPHDLRTIGLKSAASRRTMVSKETGPGVA